jgi:hypothetical protein
MELDDPGFYSGNRQVFLLFSKMSTSTQSTSEPSIQLVSEIRKPEPEAQTSFPASAEVKSNVEIYI